jgi:hypothetical protein
LFGVAEEKYWAKRSERVILWFNFLTNMGVAIGTFSTGHFNCDGGCNPGAMFANLRFIGLMQMVVGLAWDIEDMILDTGFWPVYEQGYFDKMLCDQAKSEAQSKASERMRVLCFGPPRKDNGFNFAFKHTLVGIICLVIVVNNFEHYPGDSFLMNKYEDECGYNAQQDSVAGSIFEIGTGWGDLTGDRALDWCAHNPPQELEEANQFCCPPCSWPDCKVPVDEQAMVNALVFGIFGVFFVTVWIVARCGGLWMNQDDLSQVSINV